MTKVPLRERKVSSDKRFGLTFLERGFLVQTNIGPEIGQRISHVIQREQVSISDFIRIAVTSLLSEYEEG